MKNQHCKIMCCWGPYARIQRNVQKYSNVADTIVVDDSLEVIDEDAAVAGDVSSLQLLC